MSAPTTERATYTIEEASDLAGISKFTAWRLAAAGELPGARKLGGKWVVSRLVFNNWLNESA